MTQDNRLATDLDVKSEWQHELEDGSFDHEWVTEFGVTFCSHCEKEKDFTE